MKQSFNKTWIGLLTGLIIPIFAVLLFHLSTYREMSMTEFVNQIIQMNILTPLLSICAVPNLLMFFIFIWTNKLLSARGIILATLIYAIIVFVIKFTV